MASEQRAFVRPDAGWSPQRPDLDCRHGPARPEVLRWRCGSRWPEDDLQQWGVILARPQRVREGCEGGGVSRPIRSLFASSVWVSSF